MGSLDTSAKLAQTSFESSLLEFPSEVTRLCCGKKSQASQGWEGGGSTLEPDSTGRKSHLKILGKVLALAAHTMTSERYRD